MAPPRLHRRELDGDALARLLPEHGCVWITGVVSRERAAELATGIDSVFDAYDRQAAGLPPRPGPDWYHPFGSGGTTVHDTRGWLRSGGGVFTADSPHLHPEVVETLEGSGLLDAVTELFGARPVSSLDKSTLRRVRPGDGIEWHQDGAFLGTDYGAVNLWLSLSDCRQAPGLDLVGRRFTDIVPTGTHGASYDWSVGEGLIREQGWTVLSPELRPGDALLFDGYLLHRSNQDPARSGVRHAVETWLFDPDRFPPHQQVPLAL